MFSLGNFILFFSEEIDRESQKKHQEQLRAEGKTEQARADLARLAIIRQERELAAKKRDAEKQGQFFFLFHFSPACAINRKFVLAFSVSVMASPVFINLTFSWPTMTLTLVITRFFSSLKLLYIKLKGNFDSHRDGCDLIIFC